MKNTYGLKDEICKSGKKFTKYNPLCNTNYCNGQTIIELLVALALVTLFLSGVVIVQLVAIRNVQYAQKKSIATKLAREQLERARVIRDSSGINALDICLNSSGCFINVSLTPEPIIPTGVYRLSMKLDAASALYCPPLEITPAPVVYKASATVNWGQGSLNLTPAPELTISSCLTDWR